MAPHRTVPTAALTRKEDWGTTDNEHVQDLLFKVAGIFLGIATLVVAYFHYRHPRSSRSDEEQPEPAEASSHNEVWSDVSSNGVNGGESTTTISMPAAPSAILHPRYSHEENEMERLSAR